MANYRGTMRRISGSANCSDVNAGHIFWLPAKTDCNKSLVDDPDLNDGCFNHPVLVLTANYDLQMAVLTSFHGQSLAEKFPNNVALRNQHLPIFPSTPHYDNGIQLSLADGLELRKQSYVKTTCCYTLDYKLLHNYDHSGTPYKLRSDSMEELMAYIGTTLPRRLREVLDYQPTKHNRRG